MIPKTAKLRVARPTDNLDGITKMYIEGLGFKLLGSFENHNGFDGSIIGHENHNYHLEFTHHKGTKVGKAPTQDNLLVFYFSEGADPKNRDNIRHPELMMCSNYMHSLSSQPMGVNDMAHCRLLAFGGRKETQSLQIGCVKDEHG